MFKAIKNPALVPFDGGFDIRKAPTSVDDVPDKKTYRKRLGKRVDELDDLQRRLYAEDKYAVLLVFQAMDAAG